MTAILAFFLSPLGRYVAIGLVVVAALGGIYVKGHSDGSDAVQAKWDAAVQAAIERGEKARSDAESAVDANGNSPRLRHDQHDRD